MCPGGFNGELPAGKPTDWRSSQVGHLHGKGNVPYNYNGACPDGASYAEMRTPWFHSQGQGQHGKGSQPQYSPVLYSYDQRGVDTRGGKGLGTCPGAGNSSPVTAFKPSEKVALNKDHQFDGVKDGGKWLSFTKNHFIGKAYELEPLLKMIEDYVEFPALVADVTPYAAQLVSGSRLAEISGEIWNYLNNNLQGEALQVFNNVPRMEGHEAWRKMVKMVQGSNDLRRMELKRKIQNPRRAQSLHDFRKAIEEWDTNMRHFVEAGGSNPSQ